MLLSACINILICDVGIEQLEAGKDLTGIKSSSQCAWTGPLNWFPLCFKKWHVRLSLLLKSSFSN